MSTTTRTDAAGVSTALSPRAVACELFAALMKGPRTIADLVEMVGMTEKTMVEWLRFLQDAGVVSHENSAAPRGDRGRRPALWALNPYPFMTCMAPMEHPGNRVYIAGPMTGLPEYNYPAFNRAAEQLRSAGYNAVNPAANPEPVCASWRGYMRMALAQLVTCDTVALLPGWEQSRGARIEERTGRELGLRVVLVGELLAKVPA